MAKDTLEVAAKKLYSIRREIKKLQGEEEKLKKMVMKNYEDPFTIKTLDGRKQVEVVVDDKLILKDNETISQKIGPKNFYTLAKIGVGDLRVYCEEEGFKFKWFIKKTEEGSRKIIFI